MRQRGIADGWLTLVVLAVIAVGLWYAYQTIDKRGYERGRLEVQVKFDAFTAKVKQEGEASKAKAAAEKARNEAVSKERKSSYEKRIADIASAYQWLCSQSGSCSGRLPEVPDTTRSSDAAARDQQLQAVLRYADEQTARLAELQQWVREQLN